MQHVKHRISDIKALHVTDRICKDMHNKKLRGVTGKFMVKVWRLPIKKTQVKVKKYPLNKLHKVPVTFYFNMILKWTIIN